MSGSAHLAFAPSDVSLSAEAPRGSPQNVFQGTVREIIPLTDRLRVIVDAGTPMAAEITRDAAQQLSVASGAVIWVSVKASAIRVYP